MTWTFTDLLDQPALNDLQSLKPSVIYTMPLQLTYLNFHIVDIFRVAQCNPGIISIVPTVVDVDVDIKLLLVAFYEKTLNIQK